MRILLCIFLVLSFLIISHAQESTEEATGIITANAWLVTDLDDAEIPSYYALFVELEDGSILEITNGQDVIWTGEEESYRGALLIPTDSYEYSMSMTNLEDGNRQIDTEITTGALSFETHLLYEETDLEFMIWTESERTLIEYSQFAECLGRTDVSAPLAWTTPDLLIPIRIDEEAGVLDMGSKQLPGGGGAYELISEEPFGQFTQVITQTATVDEESIALTYHSIADERDDCELAVESVLTPFDGDYEAIFEEANTLGEEE